MKYIHLSYPPHIRKIILTLRLLRHQIPVNISAYSACMKMLTFCINFRHLSNVVRTVFVGWKLYCHLPRHVGTTQDPILQPVAVFLYHLNLQWFVAYQTHKMQDVSAYLPLLVAR